MQLIAVDGGASQGLTAYGNGGDDQLLARDFGDRGTMTARMFGGDGDDRVGITQGTEGSIARGGSGDDWVTASGDGQAYGDAGNDEVGGSGGAELYGGTGNDSIRASDFQEDIGKGLMTYLDGGDGNDTLLNNFFASGSDIVEDNRLNVWEFAKIYRMSRVFEIDENVNDVVMDGGDGNDILYIHGDTLATGGEGKDTLVVLQLEASEDRPIITDYNAEDEIVLGVTSDIKLELREEETEDGLMVFGDVAGEETLLVTLEGVSAGQIDLTELRQFQIGGNFL